VDLSALSAVRVVQIMHSGVSLDVLRWLTISSGRDTKGFTVSVNGSLTSLKIVSQIAYDDAVAADWAWRQIWLTALRLKASS
jgi:hypothetical protein